MGVYLFNYITTPLVTQFLIFIDMYITYINFKFKTVLHNM